MKLYYGFIFGALWGLWMGFCIFDPWPSKQIYIDNAEKAKTECEVVIPRNQKCEVIITAVPEKTKND